MSLNSVLRSITVEHKTKALAICLPREGARLHLEAIGQTLSYAQQRLKTIQSVSHLGPAARWPSKRFKPTHL